MSKSIADKSNSWSKSRLISCLTSWSASKETEMSSSVTASKTPRSWSSEIATCFRTKTSATSLNTKRRSISWSLLLETEPRQSQSLLMPMQAWCLRAWSRQVWCTTSLDWALAPQALKLASAPSYKPWKDTLRTQWLDFQPFQAFPELLCKTTRWWATNQWKLDTKALH